MKTYNDSREGLFTELKYGDRVHGNEASQSSHLKKSKFVVLINSIIVIF